MNGAYSIKSNAMLIMSNALIQSNDNTKLLAITSKLRGEASDGKPRDVK
jgi:hypothetical protein